jgi:outer membrane cobalamin receptor
MIAVLLLAATTTMTGAVHDPSGGGVAGAAVIVRSASGVEGQAFTGPEGAFSIETSAEGDLTLLVRAGGFAEKTQRIAAADRSTPISVVLANGGMLDAVVVTAAREPGSPALPAVVSVLTALTLDASAPFRLDEQLKVVPGFSLFSRASSRATSPATQTATLRGLSGAAASRSLVLVDGAPVNDGFGGWADWNRVPMAAIDRVEVLRGAASDVYGADAAAGVINVISSSPSRAGLRVGVDGWSSALRRASVWTGGTHAGATAFASGEWQDDDGFIIVSRDVRGSIDTPVSSNYKTFYGGAGYQMGQWHVAVRASALQERRHDGTPLTTDGTDARAVNGEVAGTMGGRMWQVRGYGSHQDYEQTLSLVNGARNAESLTAVQHVPSTRGGLSAQVTDQTWRMRWTLGGEGTYVEGTSQDTVYRPLPSGVVSSSGGAQVDGGAFARALIDAGDRVTLYGSVRGDFWRSDSSASGSASTTGRALSPKLGLSWRATKMLTLQGAGLMAFRLPTPNELFRSVQTGGTLVIANTRLTSERLRGGEVSANLNMGTSTMRLTGFWNQVDDAIVDETVSTTPGIVTRQRRNGATIRAVGFELEEDVKFGSRLRLVLGEQFVSASVISAAEPDLSGTDVPQVPKLGSSMRLQYTAPLGIVAIGTYRSVGAQYDEGRNRGLLNAASVLDGSVSLPITRNARLIGAIENILDKAYDVGATPVLTIGTPRTVRVGIRVSLP